MPLCLICQRPLTYVDHLICIIPAPGLCLLASKPLPLLTSSSSPEISPCFTVCPSLVHFRSQEWNWVIISCHMDWNLKKEYNQHIIPVTFGLAHASPPLLTFSPSLTTLDWGTGTHVSRPGARFPVCRLLTPPGFSNTGLGNTEPVLGWGWNGMRRAARPNYVHLTPETNVNKMFPLVNNKTNSLRNPKGWINLQWSSLGWR